MPLQLVAAAEAAGYVRHGVAMPGGYKCSGGNVTCDRG